MSPLEPLSAHSPDSAGGDARVGSQHGASPGTAASRIARELAKVTDAKIAAAVRAGERKASLNGCDTSPEVDWRGLAHS